MSVCLSTKLYLRSYTLVGRTMAFNMNTPTAKINNVLYLSVSVFVLLEFFKHFFY
jgi:hypothetical protein